MTPFMLLTESLNIFLQYTYEYVFSQGFFTAFHSVTARLSEYSPARGRFPFIAVGEPLRWQSWKKNYPDRLHQQGKKVILSEDRPYLGLGA